MDHAEFIERCREMVEENNVRTIVSVYERTVKLADDVINFGKDGVFDTDGLTNSIADMYIGLMCLAIAINADPSDVDERIKNQLGL